MTTLRWTGLGLLTAAAIAACSAEPTGVGDERDGPAAKGDGGAPVQGPAADGAAPTTPAGQELNHVLSTGQSNAVGFRATPAISTQQTHANLMFDVGVMTAADCDGEGCRRYETPTKLVPLVEGDRYEAEQVETMSTGLGDGVATSPLGAAHPLLVSVHGRSGWVYECLRKGSCDYRTATGYLGAFDDGMKQVEDGFRLAAAIGKRHVVRAVTLVHGESDHHASSLPLDGSDGSPGAIQNYADALLELQRDYETGVRAINRQPESVPLLVSQMANWNDRPTSEIPLRQREASERAPGKVILVGPTYMLRFGADCIHFTSASQRKLGAYFAKAYVATVLEGRTFKPLAPVSAVAAGALVRVRFHVPVPPLVLDANAVTNPGAHGFALMDSPGATITQVAVSGPDEVTLTLSAPPAAGSKVTYALNASPGTCPGPDSGPRGTLRDSDSTPSDAGPLPNFSISFAEPIR